MATFTVRLTPTPVTQVSEGNLDTTVVGGYSAQRTAEDLFVVNGSDMKIVGKLADGSTYDNTTFVSSYGKDEQKDKLFSRANTGQRL